MEERQEIQNLSGIWFYTETMIRNLSQKKKKKGKPKFKNLGVANMFFKIYYQVWCFQLHFGPC